MSNSLKLLSKSTLVLRVKDYLQRQQLRGNITLAINDVEDFTRDLDIEDLPAYIRNSIGVRCNNTMKGFLDIGELVILFAKATCNSTISQNQWTLSEIGNLIRASQLLHMSIKDNAHHNNKSAVLKGDFLLAHACQKLSSLKHPKITGLVSTAIGNFAELEFTSSLPDHRNIMFWKERAYLASGSLLGHLCKSSLILAGHDQQTQQKGFEFGTSLCLAYQARSELQHFKEFQEEDPVDLLSLPVIIEMQSNEDLATYISRQECVNHEQVYKAVTEKSICWAHTMCGDLADRGIAALEALHTAHRDSTLMDTIRHLKVAF